MKERYNIQIGTEGSAILNYVELSSEELDGVVKVLTELHKSDNTPVSISDTLDNDVLCLGFDELEDKNVITIKLTNDELTLLSNGLLVLINNAGKAKMLVTDSDAQSVIDKHIEQIQRLNYKICDIDTEGE